jgi:hypothetical protein
MTEIDDSRRYTAIFYPHKGGPLRSLAFSIKDVRQATAAAARADAGDDGFDDVALAHAKSLIAEKFGVTAPLELRLARQGDYLRDAARQLGLEQKQLADRLNTPWRTFEKWLFPEDSKNQRTMPDMAWTFIDDILRDHARARRS